MRVAKSKKGPDHTDPIIAQKIREALEAPIVERAPLDVPKATPTEEMQRWGLKPLPKRGNGKSF